MERNVLSRQDFPENKVLLRLCYSYCQEVVINKKHSSRECDKNTKINSLSRKGDSEKNGSNVKEILQYSIKIDQQPSAVAR
jgi:hypothetical protein